MSDNSSSNCLTQPNVFSVLRLSCLFYKPSKIIQSIYNLTSITLILPLCVLTLHHGFHQWRKNKSSSIKHSHILTYNLALMELIGVFGNVVSIIGLHTMEPHVLLLSTIVSMSAWLGQLGFHLLTCVEHFLAVVHPVVYMKLRSRTGTRIGNVIIGCVWMLSLTEMGVVFCNVLVIYKNITILILSLLGSFFCGISVLRVLIRPSPGEQDGKKQRLDQSKRRVFHTIVAIQGVLLGRVIGNIVWGFVYRLRGSVYCVVLASSVWVNLPSSLILPLLYLIRERKLERSDQK